MYYKEYKVKVYDNGNIRWYNQDGLRHREDGPAIEYASGSKSWWKNGQLHREDGPAREYADGSKYWCFEGRYMTEEAWKARMNPVKEMTVQEISDMLGFEVKVVK